MKPITKTCVHMAGGMLRAEMCILEIRCIPKPLLLAQKPNANFEIYCCGKQADNAGQADTTVKLANKLRHGNTHHSAWNEKEVGKQSCAWVARAGALGHLTQVLRSPRYWFPSLCSVRSAKQIGPRVIWSDHSDWSRWPLGLCDLVSARTVMSLQGSLIFTWDHGLKKKN